MWFALNALDCTNLLHVSKVVTGGGGMNALGHPLWLVLLCLMVFQQHSVSFLFFAFHISLRDRFLALIAKVMGTT